MSILRSVPMVHFRAQVPARDGHAVARVIAREGLLHLVDIAHGRNIYETAPPGTAELYAAYRDLRNRIRALAEKLDVKLREPEGSLLEKNSGDLAAERETIAATIDPMAKRADQLAQTLAAARERSALLHEQLEHADRLAESSIDAQRVSSAQYVTLRFALADEHAIDTLAELLTPAPFAIVPLDSQEPKLVAVAVANFARPRLEEALRVSLTQPVTVSTLTAERLRQHWQESVAAVDAARADLDRTRSEVAATLIDLAKTVEIATLLLQAQTYFAAAGRFIVVSGWIPAEAAERMRDKIRAVAGESAVVDLERAENVAGVLEGSLRVPVLHRNPLLLRPFQRLVDLYGTASYGEIQPTAFFAIGFLLMFGLMFGDVGHGAVLFVAGWSLFRFMPQYLDYGILLMEAGAASSAFGFLYGSVFGVRSLLPTLWLEPMSDLPRFMTIAILIGAVIVTGGLTLNVINTWRSGNIRDAVYGPRGLSGALLYWVVLVLVARLLVGDRYQIPSGVIVGLAFAALVVMIAGRWVAGKFEHRRPQPVVKAQPVALKLLESSIELVDTLFSYFANTISFVRIAAFAAVHAGVFIAIFAVADTLANMRAGGVLAIVVHIAGNTVMILLEGLTVSVQVLRLEYYEFFGKFFRGGGEPYLPLMLHGEPGRKHA
ncbi:MAG: V-type ATP synthase subunit I [Thermoanaerobaculia bacterium]